MDGITKTAGKAVGAEVGEPLHLVCRAPTADVWRQYKQRSLQEAAVENELFVAQDVTNQSPGKKLWRQTDRKRSTLRTDKSSFQHGSRHPKDEQQNGTRHLPL
jgi:hypothetical protein